MQALRQLGGGILIGILSLLVVIGGSSLALAEGYIGLPPTPTQTASPTSPFPPTPTTGGPTIEPSPTIVPTSTDTPVPPTTCPPPSGWVLVTIQVGDTLQSLAARYRTTPELLAAANCLFSTELLPGYGIYVPPTSSTAPPVACGAPPGWIQYTVQPGDNLYQISLRYGVTVAQLQQANCLANPNDIHVGQRLWVPNVPTITPPVTPIEIEFGTGTPEQPTPEPATETPTPAPTDTPQPADTTAPTATGTSTPTATPSPATPPN